MADEGRSSRGGVSANVFVRVFVNAVVLFGAYIGCQLAVVALVHRLPKVEHDTAFVAGFAALSGVMLCVYALLVRLMEKRWPGEISFSPILGAGGIVSGGILFSMVFAVLAVMNVGHWIGFAQSPALAIPFIVSVAAAVGEELTFRGGIFRVLEDGFGTAIAIIVSAVAFGLVHAANHGASMASTAAIALEAGVLLGLAYAATRNLWFPIGLHFGWNFTEGGIFGAAVSGGKTHNALIQVAFSGPDLLTGGAFGPEASIVAVGVSLAASLVLAVIAFRRGQWKPMTFRMQLA